MSNGENMKVCRPIRMSGRNQVLKLHYIDAMGDHTICGMEIGEDWRYTHSGIVDCRRCINRRGRIWRGEPNRAYR